MSELYRFQNARSNDKKKSVNELVVMEEQCEAETELLNIIHVIVILKRFKPVGSGNIPTTYYTKRYALYAAQL